MPALKICLICLRSEGKLYKYDRYKLKNYYEQVTASKIDEKENLPHYFCYECAALLHKFHKFKEKCQKGQNVLKKLSLKGPITLQAIRNIDKLANNVKSSLNIITVSQRVRTYTIKSKLKPKLCKNDEPIEIDDDASTSDDDDDYENKYLDKSPPLPEIEDVQTKIEYDDNKIDEDEVMVNDETKADITIDEHEVMVNDETKADITIDEHEVMVNDESKGDITIDEHEVMVNDESKADITIDEHEVMVNDATKADIKIDEDKVMVNDETKVDIDEEKINFEVEKEPQIDDIDDAIDAIDERDVSDDDNVFLNNLKASTVNEVLVVEKKQKSTKGSKKKKAEDENEETNKKAKKFEINNSKKKTELDPNNWLKFNLSEEEAIEEFKARAQHKTFISAKYKCNDCLKGFSKEDMLNRHVKLRHSESVGPVECRFCRMRFKWQHLLTQHMRQHYTKYKCLRCDLVCPLETTALFHEEYHNGVKRKCAHCGQEFKHVSTYYTHLRTHRSEHVCTVCGVSFVSATGLRIHKKIKHINAESGATEGAQGDEEYCIRCDIRFETKKAYEEHLIHSAKHVDGIEDLELQRPLGTNPRKQPNNLKKPRRIPTDCHICGKHFATQAACRKHHLAEHPRMSFVAPHKRQICEICGISLVPGSVSSHLNTHTREKLYTCNTCGKQFISRTGMITHQLTHSSEKTVPCTLCDKRFKQLSNMKLHYRTFHLKEPYPKRNRKKKSDDISNLGVFLQEDSDDS